MARIIKRLPKAFKERYRITVRRDEIQISQPAFIIIHRDDKFKMEDNGVAIRIYNSRVVISLWKNVTIEHITLYD